MSDVALNSRDLKEVLKNAGCHQPSCPYASNDLGYPDTP